jgi:hypothetical protein
MRRTVPPRRFARHSSMPHWRLAFRRGWIGIQPARTSDLILALLGVALLGGLALAAAAAMLGRTFP